MKKKIIFAVVMVTVIMTAVLLSGCSTQKMSLAFMQSVDGEAEYVNVNIKDYDGKMLSDLLAGEKSLGAKLSFSEYGAQVLEINGIKQNEAEGRWIMIFVNLEELKDTTEYALPPIEKDGVTYYQSKDSADKLPVKKDAKYLFALITF